jgi:5-methylthioadenosine/S-adenosylhomocysteine deaminase
MNNVDHILKNACVVTMDSSFTIYNPGAVAVKEDSIVEAGLEKDICTRYKAKEVIDCNNNVLMPGLINAHTHVPMTLLRGLADDLRLDVWLMGYMMPVEREFVNPDFVRLGTYLACAEMIRSGITCFADMYYFEEDIARATSEAGMRAICAQTVLKFPTPDARSYEDSINAAREFIKHWKSDPLIVPSIAPHAPYTCPPEILKASAALAIEYDVPLHTHISETALEVENMRNEQGMPVVPYVKKQNLFEAKVIAAHCVHIDEGEMHTLQHSNVGVAHNPSSNLKLGSGIAPIKTMLDIGLNVGIGTDGPASNNDLDMFDEIRLASFIAKGSSGDPTALPARTALLMATRMGAQALHIDHITGSIESGKRADMIIVNIHPIHNSPHFSRDPNGIYAQLVYATKSTDVSDVMVNGKWLMRDHQLLTLNEKSLLSQADVYAKKIDTFLIQREKSVLSKLIAIGGAMQEESFEIQFKARIHDSTKILEALNKPEIEIIRKRHYREYDTYFFFDDADKNRLRYREDHFIEGDQITNVRYRLTLIGPVKENKYANQVLLSRSRFIAPATHGLRFYREYFNPVKDMEIQKDRLRYLVKFKDTEFFVNIDHVTLPFEGDFLEIKSTTWSQKDANHKSKLVSELLKLLGAANQEKINLDYADLALK